MQRISLKLKLKTTKMTCNLIGSLYLFHIHHHHYRCCLHHLKQAALAVSCLVKQAATGVCVLPPLLYAFHRQFHSHCAPPPIGLFTLCRLSCRQPHAHPLASFHTATTQFMFSCSHSKKKKERRKSRTIVLFSNDDKRFSPSHFHCVHIAQPSQPVTQYISLCCSFALAFSSAGRQANKQTSGRAGRRRQFWRCSK